MTYSPEFKVEALRQAKEFGSNKTAIKMGLDKKTISAWARKAGITIERRYHTVFTEQEAKFIDDNWKTMTPEQIAKELDKGIVSVKNRMKYMGYPTRSVYKEWMQSEEKFLRENWHKMTCSDIAIHLGRKYAAVWQRAKRIGLHGRKQCKN